MAHGGDARRHLSPRARDRRPLPALPGRGLRAEDALGHAHRPTHHRADHGHAARRRSQRAPGGPARRALHLDGSLYEWERVVKLGDRLRADCYLKSLTEKESSFGGGRALYQTYEAVYYDQDGRRVGLRNDTWIRIERGKARETKKYGEIALARWT